MAESNQAPVKEPDLSRGEKTANRRHNERVKLVSSFFNSMGLAIFGLTILRVVLDPSAQRPSAAVVIPAIVIAMSFEALAYYLLKMLKAES